jgi:hypothetical protein
LIGNLCKPTSVASYLQVTDDKPLVYLQSFCLEQLNLRSAGNQDKLQIISSQLPALWPNLMDIMELESSEYLPHDLAIIVERLVEIRRSTFENATERSDDDYVQWPNPEVEHPTQYYPNWQIFRYPKKYNVRSKQDSDFCDKSFDSKKGFAYGIFSVGCSCPSNVTYGFELMLTRESAHNLFRYFCYLELLFIYIYIC